MNVRGALDNQWIRFDQSAPLIVYSRTRPSRTWICSR